MAEGNYCPSDFFCPIAEFLNMTMDNIIHDMTTVCDELNKLQYCLTAYLLQGNATTPIAPPTTSSSFCFPSPSNAHVLQHLNDETRNKKTDRFLGLRTGKNRVALQCHGPLSEASACELDFLCWTEGETDYEPVTLLYVKKDLSSAKQLLYRSSAIKPITISSAWIVAAGRSRGKLSWSCLACYIG